jgi:ribosomal protein L18
MTTIVTNNGAFRLNVETSKNSNVVYVKIVDKTNNTTTIIHETTKYELKKELLQVIRELE